MTRPCYGWQRGSLLLVATFLGALVAAVPTAQAASPVYRVTLKNLARSQAFSPTLFVAHQPGYHLFALGKTASTGMRLIAEDGAPRTAADAARALKTTVAVQTTRGMIGPGRSVSVEITAPAGSHLSLATMLEQTNDGFTGADAVALPAKGSARITLLAYDAGTEANNELRTHVPGNPFAGFRRAPTTVPISVHPGIKGTGALDKKVWGWTNPIGQLLIERIR